MIRRIAQYESPPLDEVASGIIFPPIADLRLPHFGLFWREVFEQFPLCEHAPPVDMGVAAVGAMDTTGFPVPWPRIWLISSEDDKLIQLQQDRFLLNWRSGKNRAKYSNYSSLFEEFEVLWGKYLAFLSQYSLHIPKPSKYELTYVNVLRKDSGWRPTDDIGAVLRYGAWESKDMKYLKFPPSLATWSMQFKLEDLGDLVVRMSPAIAKDSGDQVIRLELTVVGPAVDQKRRMVDWFDAAHEAIVRGFEDITTVQAQTEIWRKFKNE